MELGLHNTINGWEPYNTDEDSTLFIGDTHDTLVRLALADIYNDYPVVFIGDIDEILKKIPRERQPETQIIKPSLQPFALNVLAEDHPLLASVLLDSLKGVWGYDRTATPILDMYLRAGIMTMQEAELSFLQLKRFLTEYEYRKHTLSLIDDRFLKDFWKDYDTLSDKDQRNDTSSTLNKLWAFLLDMDIRYSLGQPDSRIDFNGIVLIGLNENDRILGSFILAQLYLTGNTTLYLEDAHLYGSFVQKLPSQVLTMMSVPTLSLFPRDRIPSILQSFDQMCVFRVGDDDYRHLDSTMGIPELGIHPQELDDGFALFAKYGDSTRLEMPLNSCPMTRQENKVIRRCKSQYTLPIKEIEKLIG